MSTPSSWDFDESTGGYNAAQTPGVWVVDLVVNVKTSVTCVGLPFFDPERPLRGTKPARESIVKLLTGKCGDINPLNYRDKYEIDQVTPDPYFKVAPGWSTLSGGRKPYITRKPADIADMILSVCQCVPFVKQVKVYVITPDGTKRPSSIDELKEMNIDTVTVPNLYKQNVASNSNGSNAASPSLDLSPILQTQRNQELAIAEMREQMTASASIAMQMKELLEQMKSQAPAPAPAPAPAAEPPVEKRSKRARK